MEMLTRGILLALWLVLSVVAQAHTQIPSASTDGYAWLSAQQVPSGAIQAPADLAGPLQTTYEATLAFANSDLLGQLDLASLSAYLDQQQTVG